MSASSERLWQGVTTQPYPAPGDVAALATVKSTLHARRDAASHAHDRLHAIGSSQSTWDGEAADTFRSTLGKLLPNLQKATNSFGQAGDAVATFRAGLARLQTRADNLRPRLQHAEATLRSVQGGRWSFDVAAHNQWVQAHNALVPLLQQAADIADEYRTLAHTCASRLDDASHAGIRNSWRTWAGAHEKDLEKISEYSGAIADLSGDAAMVATAVAAATGLTGIGAPVAAALAPVIVVLNATQKVATVVRLASDVGLAFAQQTNYGRVSKETYLDIAGDAVAAAFLVPALSPGEQMTKRLTRAPIAEQVKAGRAALAAKDFPAFKLAYGKADAIDRLRNVAAPVIDDEVEGIGSSVREVFDSTSGKGSATCR